MSAFLIGICLSPSVYAAETVLRYTDHEPYGNMRTRAINEIFFRSIEQESRGKVKIEAHWGGELSTSYNALKTVAEGKRADMGTVVPEYTPDQLPLHQIFKSFPVGPENGNAQVAFFKRIFQQNPNFSHELMKNNLINLQFFLGYPAGFFSVKPALQLNKLNGTRWRTASFWHQAWLRNAGGTLVSMPWNDNISNALRNGQLDGLLVNLDSGNDIQAQRAARWVSYSPALWLGHVYLLAINKDAWAALDEKDKAAIRRAAESTEKQPGTLLDKSLLSIGETMEKEGTHLHRLSRTELQRWQDASRYQQVQNEWVQAQEEKGNIEAALMIRAVSKELNTISGN
jgi:TRAP-type C4-dicarboxylate transport system substrate-binding protein